MHAAFMQHACSMHALFRREVLAIKPVASFLGFEILIFQVRLAAREIKLRLTVRRTESKNKVQETKGEFRQNRLSVKVYQNLITCIAPFMFYKQLY